MSLIDRAEPSHTTQQLLDATIAAMDYLAARGVTAVPMGDGRAACFRRHADLARPDLVGVVLHPPGTRIPLGQLPARGPPDGAFAVEEERARLMAQWPQFPLMIVLSAPSGAYAVAPGLRVSSAQGPIVDIEQGLTADPPWYTRESAPILLRMQVRALQAVLTATTALTLIALEKAIEQILGAVRDLVNGALGFRLVR